MESQLLFKSKAQFADEEDSVSRNNKNPRVTGRGYECCHAAPQRFNDGA